MQWKTEVPFPQGVTLSPDIADCNDSIPQGTRESTPLSARLIVTACSLGLAEADESRVDVELLTLLSNISNIRRRIAPDAGN